MNETFLIDVEEHDFQSKVIDESFQRPVLIDFWAAWCGPCRMLGPILEKVVESYAGHILLAKIESDQNQSLAARYGVRGIPAVFLISKGEVLGQFNGALPEAQIRAFIEENLPSDADFVVEEAEKLFSEHQFEEAEKLFQKALLLDTGHDGALIGLAKARVYQGNFDQALSCFEDANLQNLKLVELRDFIHFLIEARSQVNQLGSLLSSEETDDPDVWYAKALQKVVDLNWEDALAALLELLRLNKFYKDGFARKAMVTIFKELGPKHPLTLQYQKNMARYLY